MQGRVLSGGGGGGGGGLHLVPAAPRGGDSGAEATRAAGGAQVSRISSVADETETSGFLARARKGLGMGSAEEEDEESGGGGVAEVAMRVAERGDKPEDSLCPGLSFRQRLTGCLVCLLLGSAVSGAAMGHLDEVFDGYPGMFAKLNFVGTLLSLAGE
eukprot:COSAG01_NODE_8945_length_2606_cov_3.296651_3_plen_158_part_00